MSRRKKTVPVIRVEIAPHSLDVSMTERVLNMFKTKEKGNSVSDKDMEKFQEIIDDPDTTQEDLSSLLGILRRFLEEIHARGAQDAQPGYALIPSASLHPMPSMPPMPSMVPHHILPGRPAHAQLVTTHSALQPNSLPLPRFVVPQTLRPAHSMPSHPPARLVHSSLPVRSQPIHPSVPPAQHASISRSKSMKR